MGEHRLFVTKDHDGYLLGKIDESFFSGAYLSPQYLNRLRQLRNAAQTRLDALGKRDIPQALAELMWMIDQLLEAHAVQARAEAAPDTVARDIELTRAMAELDELTRQLEGRPRGPDKPKKK